MSGTAFGLGLHAVLSVLTGAYRLSKQQVAQLCSDLLGLPISAGMIAKLERITADVLDQPVSELAEHVKTPKRRTSTRPTGGTMGARPGPGSW
jgi:transposase